MKTHPSVYWEDTEEKVRTLSYQDGGWRFPFKFPVRFSKRGSERNILNEGDVTAPIRIEFIGRAINPSVSNETTGEMILINRELSEGDKLIINTAKGKKDVKIIRADGTTESTMNYIDLRSTFFGLQPGENTISYKSNDDTQNTRVVLYYTPLYVGV
ncbi:hypothetical protein ABNF65_21460 [Paenibacillus larvae]